MKINLWICLATPDGNSARHWVLDIVGTSRFIRLPIKYSSSNKRWMRIESWLENKFYRWVMVGY